MNTTTAIEKMVITAEPQVCSARYSACGKYLLAGSFVGNVRRWDVSAEEPREIDSFDHHNGWVEAVVSHGDVVYSADSWGCIQAWSLESGEIRWTLQEAHDGWCRQLALSPDGKTLASCGRDGVVNLWRTNDGTLVSSIRERNEDVFCVRFTPDGKHLVTGDFGGRVTLREVETGKHVRDFDASQLQELHRLQDCGGVRCLAFDAGGTRLLVGGTTPSNGGTVRGVPTLLIFDFASGELVQMKELGVTNDCFVHEVQLHEDGFVMAVTSGTPGSGKFLFQELDADKPFFVAPKLVNCHSLTRSPDGKRIAITTTNRNSNGNGRRLDKDGKYTGNVTPIHVFELQ